MGKLGMDDDRERGRGRRRGDETGIDWHCMCLCAEVKEIKGTKGKCPPKSKNPWDGDGMG